jgi:hypothetical protein
MTEHVSKPLISLLQISLFFGLLIFPRSSSASGLPILSDSQLLNQVQYRAFRFFWDQADPKTGLVKDRANNFSHDSYTVASIASTGYALASLTIGVQRHWVSKSTAQKRAVTTLQFLTTRCPRVHRWFYHFVDMHSGARVWNCELSTIDTGLLLLGAQICNNYFEYPQLKTLTNNLTDQVDWNWMRINGGLLPQKMTLSMGWFPEKGFLSSEWNNYSEGLLLYILGISARHNSLPSESWYSWSRQEYTYAGLNTIGNGPLFLYQMLFGFLNVKGFKDRTHIDYWLAAKNSNLINHRFCMDKATRKNGWSSEIWGLNASDGPDGYRAYAPDESSDGTVSPNSAIASIIFLPQIAVKSAQAFYNLYGSHIWGRYGFSDAMNAERNWYDGDVIGIDLGMALIAVENHRTGLIWRLSKPLLRTFEMRMQEKNSETQSKTPAASFRNEKIEIVFLPAISEALDGHISGGIISA